MKSTRYASAAMLAIVSALALAVVDCGSDCPDCGVLQASPDTRDDSLANETAGADVADGAPPDTDGDNGTKDTTPPWDGSGCKPTGLLCSTHAECCTGLCDMGTTPRRCYLISPTCKYVGEPCTKNPDCCSPFCDGTKCVPSP